MRDTGPGSILPEVVGDRKLKGLRFRPSRNSKNMIPIWAMSEAIAASSIKPIPEDPNRTPSAMPGGCNQIID